MSLAGNHGIATTLARREPEERPECMRCLEVAALQISNSISTGRMIRGGETDRISRLRRVNSGNGIRIVF